MKMIEIIKKTKHVYHYINFCLSTLVSGMFSVCIGSIIPYLSEQSGIPEIQYSSLLACKGYGMTIGALISNYLHRKQFCPTNHQILMTSAVMIAISSILFALSSTLLYQQFWLFIGSISLMSLDVQINVATVNICSRELLDFWMQLIWAMFSLGAIISPMLVYLFGTKMLFILAFISLLNSIAYKYLETPEYLQKENFDNSQQIKRKLVLIEDQTQKRQINWKIYYCLCFLRFLYIGYLISIAMWTPSYAVITKSANKQNANIFPSIFWSISTFFEFIVATVSLKSSQKIIYGLIGIIGTLFITILLVLLGYTLQGIYFYSILLAIFMSPIYASIFSVCSQFNYQLKGYQISILCIWGSIGQAILVPMTGWVMDLISVNFFLVFMLILGIIMLFSSLILVRQLKKKKQLPIQKHQEIKSVQQI